MVNLHHKMSTLWKKKRAKSMVKFVRSINGNENWRYLKNVDTLLGSEREERFLQSFKKNRVYATKNIRYGPQSYYNTIKRET